MITETLVSGSRQINRIRYKHRTHRESSDGQEYLCWLQELLEENKRNKGIITDQHELLDVYRSGLVSCKQPLENQITDITDVSEEEMDMSKRLKQRVTLAGKPQWVTGESMQELFDAYLQRAIDLGIVILASNETKNSLPAADVLFEKRAWQWFNLYKVGKIRLNTLANYELYLKKHIIPYFGQRDIRTITIDDVQEFMNSKADYAKKTIDEFLLALSMVLEAAKEDGLISINPAKSKRLRNPSTKKTVREALTSAEADDIEAHLQDIPQLRDRRYVAMLLKFPARCEDIRGLQIKDFNFDDMTVTIRQGVTYAKGNMLIGDPKTPAGKRKMLILPGLLETLELSEEEKNDPDAYIIPSLKDPHEPISFQADRRLWERVKNSINVYGKTPHCFRHTFATRAHRAGVDDKTLQSMGGWKDLSTMKNIYIHTQQEDLEIARQKLTALPS
ncbi:MAG: site-specific integrase [Clostridia bacterium]|nr:site-specific integrase [Clostridia bacterium]